MLRVWAGNEAVGVLSRDSGGSGSTFAYDRGASSGNAVSLTMPKRPESWDVRRGLLPIFDMSLPEGALRAKIYDAFSKASGKFDEIDLLKVVGRSQIGRLRFTGMEESLDDEVPFGSVDEILKTATEPEYMERLLEKFAVHSGISGVQPKVMVRDEDGEEGLRKSVSLKGATHIVKWWEASEYQELAANEFFCMTVAREAGLDVPAFDLSDGGLALVVERFDRTDDGYLGFEDFCVLNGVQSRFKYDGGYETKLFKRIKDFVSPEHLNDALEQAFHTILLSCAIRNGDAHLKNFGVLYRDSDSPVRLAPVYDIVTTAAYIKDDIMALTLDGTKRWPDRKRLELLGTTRAKLRPQRIAEMVERTCDAVSDVSAHAAAYFDESRYPETGRRMLAQWQAGLASLGCERTIHQVTLPEEGSSPKP